jgi:hypothetical protein
LLTLTTFTPSRCKGKRNEDTTLQTTNVVSLKKTHFFPAWLSGFIEAEGSFSTRSSSSKSKSFSIGQNAEKQLLIEIRNYFKATNQIRLYSLAKLAPNPLKGVRGKGLAFLGITDKPKRNKTSFFLLEIYQRQSLILIQKHCQTYPLLGEKLNSFLVFYS